MSAAKKKTPSPLVPAWQRTLGRWLWGTGRPVLILALVVAILAGGSYWAWMRLGSRILRSPEYIVGPEQVEINPPPKWIQTDIRAAAFRQPTLDGELSLMDDSLIERTRSAFKQLPWVASVRSVVKRHPASVYVELEYRQPVCMVEVGRGVLPVDAEATLLPPDDFTSVEAARYPHLSGVDQMPIGPVGRRWNDPRVIGGAEIAAALGKVWEKMKLYSIEVLPVNAAESAAAGHRANEPMFALRTRVGTRIIWGYAPHANVPGELPAAEKLARLRQYYDDNDSFDDRQGQPQQLDVRTLGENASHK